MRHENLTRTIELVKQAQAGDGDALDRLFARYFDRVLRIVRIRLGKKLRRDFESGDILQEAFRVAFLKFDSFEMRDEASFIHWLRQIVEHQITDKHDWQSARSRSRDREVEMQGATDGEGEPIGFEPPDPKTAPLDKLVSKEGSTEVETHLAALGDTYRELILLRDYEGHAWDRIAELTGRPSPDAARMMYQKALLALGRLIRAARASGSGA